MKRILIGIGLTLFGVYGMIRIIPLPTLAELLGGPLPDYGIWSLIGLISTYVMIGIGGILILSPTPSKGNLDRPSQL